MTDAQGIWRDIERIRAERPLVHNITNYVAMSLTANALLALGASPVMAHAPEEVAEMAGLARALVLNIGTLSRPWIEAMGLAAAAARAAGIPIVLDPVGAGATRFRTETALALLETARPAVLRGNASEIRALALAEAGTKGVDSRHDPADALEAARMLAGRFGPVVSVSGPVDIIVGPAALVRVANGHPLMPRVTGLGCVATALTGAFTAVNPSPFAAAVHAMAVMGIAGEMAAEGASGPASLQVRFLDALYALSAEAVRSRLRLEEG
ncbi:MAG: hydroxyethylthiazole kinase [Candidatus Aminicenantes bacterium]|nr:hydroxyethylthiazole kinase [Candidatus Aminicenantes bacterium]